MLRLFDRSSSGSIPLLSDAYVTYARLQYLSAAPDSGIEARSLPRYAGRGMGHRSFLSRSVLSVKKWLNLVLPLRGHCQTTECEFMRTEAKMHMVAIHGSFSRIRVPNTGQELHGE
jgi:hypothetical protein